MARELKRPGAADVCTVLGTARTVPGKVGRRWLPFKLVQRNSNFSKPRPQGPKVLEVKAVLVLKDQGEIRA